MFLFHILFVTLLISETIFSGFPANTLIKTQTGYTEIQNLQIEDIVGCFDVQQKELVYKKILGIQLYHETNCYCVVIEHEKITVAADHEFYLPVEKIWKRAKGLKPGDILFKKCNEHISIQEVFPIQAGIDLFDLSIQDCHNFCVSNNEVLVHNFFPIIVGVTFAFGGGAIEFAGISAAIVTAGGIIALNLRKKQTKSPTIYAKELSQNLGASTHYCLQDGIYEVIVQGDVAHLHDTVKPSSKILKPTSNNNYIIQTPEDPEEDKEKNQTKNNCSGVPDTRSTNELFREIKSLQKQIEKHQTKLMEYIQNPDKCDNLNLLKRATTQQQRTNIINSRIRLLNGEINRFQQTMNKAIYVLNQRGIKWN